MSKQKDGRYRAKLKIGNDKDGNPIYKYASGRTKKELASNLEELKKAHITGNTDARRDILFGVFAQEWYDAYKKPFLSPAGQGVYATIFNAHLFPAFADKQMRAITAPSLQQFINSKAFMGKSTIDKIYGITRSVFRAATAQYVIDRDPSLSLIKPEVEENHRRALTEKESTAALKVGHTHKYGLLLLLTFYTGARIGEIVGLKWSDYDSKNKTIKIERDIDFETCSEGELKTETARRAIPIADALVTALNAVRGVGDAYILQRPNGAHLSSHALRSRWDKLMTAMYEEDNTMENSSIHIRSRTKKYQKQEPPRMSILTPHYFRHNFVSVLYNADVDVLAAQKMVGHKDVKTTLGIYSHLSEGKEDKNNAKARAAFDKFQ